MSKSTFLCLVITIFALSSCVVKSQSNNESTPLSGEHEVTFLNVPDGFAVELYADDVKNARSLALSESGWLFIGTRSAGNVYAVRDTDGDNKADEKYTLAMGLHMPNGVALKDGDLYVAEVSRIIKFPDVESNLKNEMDFEVVFDDYPDKDHHGWKYIAFGPDEKLYVPVGAPCNICESEDEIFNTITRMNADGSDMEIVHSGIRNTVGFNWHPVTGELYFSDNGGDMLGDDFPGDELNRAPNDGMHFGYPYCHQGDTLDKKFGSGKDCADYTAPIQTLDAHVAALGIEFYKEGNFPEEYANKVFIAEHGSWNRTVPIGYRLTMVELADGKSVDYSTFVDGFRDNDANELNGRPVDLEWMPDGSLLISDDQAGKVYRMVYTK